MSSIADPLVVAALVAAVPSSIAAYAALRANHKVSTNGSKKSIGMLVEDMNVKLDRHVNDLQAHCREAHKHVLNAEGVCTLCGNLV